MTKTVTLDLARDLDVDVDAFALRQCARQLIRAYAIDPQDVDWSDVQVALDSALKAFGLPEDYPERVAHGFGKEG